jgi:PAS domain S-box-containing protein
MAAEQVQGNPSPGDRMEETLAHYRQMAEFSLDGIVITDLGGRVLIANPAVLSMLEFDSTTAARPMTVFDFIAPESIAAVQRDFFNMEEGRKAVMRTYKAISARGNPRCVEVIGNRITYDGKPANIISVRDVTRRRAMEEALKTSERKFELLARTSIDIINYHDPDLTLTYISPAVKAVLGYDPEEIRGRNLLEFAYPEDIPYLQGVHNQLMNREHDVATLECRMLHKGGRVVWLESTVHAISDSADGRIKEFYNITRDITPRKTAEETAHRRDRVLHAFATASGFLLTGRLRDPIPRVLATIGEAMAADVAYIYEDTLVETQGSHTAVRRYRWARETTGSGAGRTIACDKEHNFPIEWSHRLASRVWISGCLSRFQMADREVLEDLGIHSLLFVPIFVRDSYWGFVGVSDLCVDRVWDDTEIEILMTLAATIGLVFEQRPEIIAGGGKNRD